MLRIINHWTAGTYVASVLDRQYYHYIIDGDAELVLGKFPVSANRPGLRLRTGRYATHTLGCNSGSIGVSCCGMHGAIESPLNYGKFPLKEKQWEALIMLNAELCNKYDIRVSPKTVLTHAEAHENLGKPQKGKWDIAHLEFLPRIVGARAVGNELRRRVEERIHGSA